MTKLMDQFRAMSGSALDISEHLGLLRGLAMDPEVKQIVEIGFRKGVSATALCTAGKPVLGIDIEPCMPHRRQLTLMAPKFSFIRGDSLKIEIPKCELLHIDSLHTYDHLLKELRRHSPRCSKWIAMHDTATFAHMGKDGSKLGLWDALTTFLRENREWRLQLHLDNCNGMTVLMRDASRPAEELSTPQ